MTTKTVVAVNQLVAGYGNETVLANVSLTVKRGEVVAIIGKSGVGKSTLLEAILGNLNGKITMSVEKLTLLEKNWQQATPAEKRHMYRHHIGIIFQNAYTSLDPVLTVRQQLEEVMHPSSEEDVRTLLRQVHLEEDCLSLYPHELSGGMLQRVAFALAICHEPELIVADEPYSAMDPLLQEEMMQLLVSYVQNKQASCILVTHNRHLAMRYCTTMYTLEQKQLRLYSSAAHAHSAKQNEASVPHHTRPLFSVSQLKKRFANQTIGIQDANFVISEGDMVGIIGQSGAGKTTIAKLLSGLLPYEEGSISFRGKELQTTLQAIGQQYYREVQYVFQNSATSFHPRRTIEKSLEEPLRFLMKISSHEKRLERIHEVFQWLELDEAWLSKRPYQLSGGQLQRCAIVRALLTQPRCLILDEVTSALDYENRHLVMDVLQKIHQESETTILLISHQIFLMERYCDRLLVMKEGSIVDEVLLPIRQENILHDYTKQLLQR